MGHGLHCCAVASKVPEAPADDTLLPAGQLNSLYTEPFLTHVEPFILAVTAFVPLQTRPGGQVWHTSVLGSTMYSVGRHGLHCCASCEYVPLELPSVELMSCVPGGQLTRRY